MQATIDGLCAEALDCNVDSMNREIRFRAWDMGSNKMIYPDSKESNHVRLYLNGSVAIQDCRATQDVELMQRTGLNDKNGTPVYEGDIVNELGIGVVKYYRTGYEVKGKHTSSPLMSRGHGHKENDIEVLGNVREHPELLP